MTGAMEAAEDGLQDGGAEAAFVRMVENDGGAHIFYYKALYRQG